VSGHIEVFLSQARELIEQEGLDEGRSNVLTELSLLIVHCIEVTSSPFLLDRIGEWAG
jgi:hypothetical protein